MIRTILEHGAQANAHDANGKTPIFYASGQGGFCMLPILMQKGADPSIPDAKNGQTALDVASNKYTRVLLIVYVNSANNLKEEDVRWIN
jgi:ankyrin repeat protein